MANQKISELPVASSVTGADVVPVVQSGTTKQAALAELVALALSSPAMTGTPTAPTPASNDNSTKVATTAFVLAQVAALINSAPGVLDTLGEIATALQADEGALAALTSAVAMKASLASPALTGNPTAPTQTQGDNDTSIATTAYVDTGLATRMQALTVTPIKTVDYAAAPFEMARFDLSSGSHVLTLPTTPGDKTLIGGKITALTGANTLTINCGGTDTINRPGGVQTFTLGLLGQGVIAEYKASDGTWTILADDIPLSQLDARFLGLTAAIPESQVTGLTADLAAKAPLASPTFTGDPKAPTPAPGDNDTSIATTAFVKAALDALVNGAPGILDTLGEIATQLQSDESTAAALATTVAGKAPLASPTFTGDPKAPTPATSDNDTSIATTAFVQAVAALLIAQSLIDAKGDLLVGSADNTVIRKAVGTDGQVLTADSASTGGVKWAAAAAAATVLAYNTSSTSVGHSGVFSGENVLATLAIPTSAKAGDHFKARIVFKQTTGDSNGGRMRFRIGATSTTGTQLADFVIGANGWQTSRTHQSDVDIFIRGTADQVIGGAHRQVTSNNVETHYSVETTSTEDTTAGRNFYFIARADSSTASSPTWQILSATLEKQAS